MRPAFAQRLAEVMEKGDLTVGDLRYWFGRPYPTVRVWRYDGREPTGPGGRQAYERLALLEKALRRKGLFPVPPETSKRIRPAHIRQIRDALENGGVSKSHPAG